MTHDHARSTIAFIGGGNMARSLIGGLVARGVPAAAIRVAEPVDALREALARDFGVACSTRQRADRRRRRGDLGAGGEAAGDARGVRGAGARWRRRTRPLIVSIAAGITTAQLDRWLGGGSADRAHDAEHAGAARRRRHRPVRQRARRCRSSATRTQQLLGAAGRTVWIDDEARMDAVTAVSGSGPAYVFLLAEAMQAAGEAEGLSPDAARALALADHPRRRAACSSKAMSTPAELRRRVTSPGGTTHAAIETFEAGGFRDLVAPRHPRRRRCAASELSAAND